MRQQMAALGYAEEMDRAGRLVWLRDLWLACIAGAVRIREGAWRKYFSRGEARQREPEPGG